MKFPKAAFILAIACFMLLTVSACGQEQGEEMYVLCPYTTGTLSTATSGVMDITIEKQVWKIGESETIPIVVGVGREYHPNSVQDSNAVLSVSSSGCTVNGEADTWSSEYSDFFSNQKFDLDVKEKLWFMVPELTPRYHETIEMTFPDGVCEGEISIILTTTRAYYGTAVKDYTLNYIKNDSEIVFYLEGEDGQYSREQAQRLLG